LREKKKEEQGKLFDTSQHRVKWGFSVVYRYIACDCMLRILYGG
jgi:hypothetical protein